MRAADHCVADVSHRDRILDAAEALARRAGYYSFSMVNVADGAGLSEDELWRSFADKPTLATALVERYTARTIEALGDPREPDAIARLVEAYRLVAKHDGEMCLCGLYGAEIDGLPQSVALATRKHYREINAWIQRALGCDHDARHPSAIIAGLCGALLTTKSMNDPDAFETIAWQLIRPVTENCARE